MSHRITYVFLLLSLWGCSFSDKINRNPMEVDIDGKRNNVSIFDIFERIEIIPLETNQSSQLHFIDRLVCCNDVLYIHDFSGKKIMAFDSAGKFLYKIDDRGQGPDEYLYISDFDIDKQGSKMFIVDPVSNTLLEYDLTGKFSSKIKLPTIECAYGELKCLDNDKIVFWTYDYKNRLKFYDKSDNHIFQEYFPKKDRSLLDHFTVRAFPYCNYATTTSVVDNNIYEISSDGIYSIAYTWDFGKLNNSVDIAKKFPERNLDWEERRVLSNQMRFSEIVNYYFVCIGGNRTYRYAQIARNGKMVNLWHKISEKKTFVFEKTIENAAFYPLYWDDAFVIGFGPFGGHSVLEETVPDIILNKEDLIKKRQIEENDNPVLIKYYFKK
ncbi:hypothetical protein FACS1894155_12350 [Bacteroidia bacterium]|nr:hypothetical protein FACS1894155_12350 [Bacteroidia bacterium]